MKILCQILLIVCFIFITSASFGKNEDLTEISLAGIWDFQLDPDDIGEKEDWFRQSFSDTIRLPGSLQEQGYGDEISVDTKWIGDISDHTQTNWNGLIGRIEMRAVKLKWKLKSRLKVFATFISKRTREGSFEWINLFSV